jgi:hypothetical protein
MKIICFDLDNVICTNKRYKNGLINYKSSKPIKKTIRTINYLYSKGYQVDIFTARGMSRYNGDMTLILKKLKKITISQLKKWKLNFHNLYFGKVYYDFFVDDKCYGYSKEWQNDIEKILKKKF